MANPNTKHINRLLYIFSLKFIKILLLIFTAMLLFSGILITSYSTDMETQLVLFQWNNPFFTVFGTCLLGFFFLFVSYLICKKNSIPKLRLLRFFVLFWCMLSGIIQILFSKTVPAGDGYSVYSIAEKLALGDFSVIHPYDSYISYYPQQIGLVAFWEILIRIWKLTNVNLQAYHFIKLVYILLECVIIIFQEKIVHILWKNEKVECLYLILAGSNCPLLMYTSFVYGEIPSFTTISISIYFLIRILRKKYDQTHPWLLSFGCIFFMALSVMLRKNSLIFMIAAVCVTLIWGFWQKRPKLFVISILCIVCSLLILPCVQKIYEFRSGNTINSGVTALSYIAMGMQESSRADGWYNGFNFNTYKNANMDTDAANAISKEAIQERLTYFSENPDYAVKFYLHKYLSQWVDGTYACRQATLATFGGRTPLFESFYVGKSSKYLIIYCKLYQNILYFGSFWYCLVSLRKKTFGFHLPAYIGLISVFGGFLFHMIWEGNSRYIFLYGLSLLPFAAKGLSMLMDSFMYKYVNK